MKLHNKAKLRRFKAKVNSWCLRSWPYLCFIGNVSFRIMVVGLLYVLALRGAVLYEQVTQTNVILDYMVRH